ncbi:proteoglycan 4b isoform X2 [Cololabis saira]|uniref:proteoglycan 4b isoform X2 n=1 Tax=Cololabis saira TaxID=129043 RepID=UPI002AD5607B|nr:proteoglycan 4b isoform X2 [Cololabis saira]
MMPSKVLCAAAFLACALKFGSTESSCNGRCGAEYYRGYMCQCDYTCLEYGECCDDYESKCTTTDSCRGRCGESFKRGRLCTCDPDCAKYKQCCSDYKAHCAAEDPTLTEATNEPPLGDENNADDYIIPLDGPTSYPPDDFTDDTDNQINPGDEEDPEPSTTPESSSGNGLSTIDPLDQTPIEPTLSPDNQDQTPVDPTLSPDALDQTIEPTLGPDNQDQTPVDPTLGPDNQDQTPVDPTLGPDNQDQTPVDPTLGPDAQDQTPVDPTLGPDTLELTTEPNKADDVGLSTRSPTTEEPTADLTEGTALPSVPETVPAASTDAPEVVTSSRPSQEPEVTPMDTQDPTPAIPEETTSISDTDNDPATDAPSISSTAAVNEETTRSNVPLEITTSSPVKAPLKTTSPPVSEPTTKPAGKPAPSKPLPPSKPDTKPGKDPQTVNIDDPRNYQGDDSNDTNLCSGRPVGGMTTLRNGTIAVFRGHYFWTLDRNRVPGPARGITDVWGVPSPIDTVFTRCNCQGKTYIFKGGQYWRFENDVLDTGFPRVVSTGFGGLRGHITAALSVPQYRSRGESVYFFKRGGFVQKYSYQFGTTSKCGRKVTYPMKTILIRKVRQAVSVLEPTINIRTSWRGFPSTITAAVSVPSTREPDGYKYVVYSRTKSYSVRLDGQRPVIAPPKPNVAPQTSDVFKCPKKS